MADAGADTGRGHASSMCQLQNRTSGLGAGPLVGYTCTGAASPLLQLHSQLHSAPCFSQQDPSPKNPTAQRGSCLELTCELEGDSHTQSGSRCASGTSKSARGRGPGHSARGTNVLPQANARQRHVHIADSDPEKNELSRHLEPAQAPSSFTCSAASVLEIHPRNQGAFPGHTATGPFLRTPGAFQRDGSALSPGKDGDTGLYTGSSSPKQTCGPALFTIRNHPEEIQSNLKTAQRMG
ncbi:hypothetical protein TREES_T100015638 [Tupaia chinensis]|uniref:Uncharacterized protein n=1 Tax=Tupaia chinensis TaxID=246437 RepID=L9L943_TUPCH|nr:hypothetical protein TREES_T100015638 [Tupaia chinensis]